VIGIECIDANVYCSSRPFRDLDKRSHSESKLFSFVQKLFPRCPGIGCESWVYLLWLLALGEL
jgi:hypothetical protein